KFQRLSGREHILQRSDMYVGSTSPDVLDMYVIDDKMGLSRRDVRVAPAFLQVVEEAIMNAADRVSAAHEDHSKIHHKTTKIRVDVKGREVSVHNNGDGVVCDFLDEFGVYAPELIFGHLRTSSNYDDKEERLNVGRNGIGIKIASIFSDTFTVETVDFVKKKKYTQVFRENMKVVEKPRISNFSGDPYTRVTFSVEGSRFGIEGDVPEDVVSVIRRRCHEVLLCSLDPVKVVFNGASLKTNTLEKYLALYGVEKSCIATCTAPRWKFAVAFTPDVGHFRQLSFVNSTSTPQGGTHVNYVVDGFVKSLLAHMRKKWKSPRLKSSVVKDLLTVVVSAHVVNPTFSGQTKDMLTLPSKDFGSTFSVPESVLSRMLKTGIVDFVGEVLKNKEASMLNDNDGKKSKVVRGVPKLHDAQWAGTRKSSECLLIVTEGDSALTMALSATSVIGREKFGCFPLRGKLLNVRDAPSHQVSNNAEITNIKKILGLQNGIKYDEDSLKELRYGGIILLTDADLDGSHIRGLLLNLFDTFWPDLLRLGYVKSISTPIVRATKSRSSSQGEVLTFYNDFDYCAWKENISQSELSGYKIKYLKGLGSSTPAEAREYFSNVYDSLVKYACDENSRENMSLAFDKTRSGDRKRWLTSYNPELIIGSALREVGISDFVNRELIHFSQGDLLRSMPSVVDGLKLSQRKALCGSFMKGIEKVEAKVAQLTGFVSDKMQYHHGETSMSGTIQNMAQDFVGSNNINFLLPKGQLGSRLSNGSDAASPRYTSVQMNPLTSLLFRKEDGPVLRWNTDEGVTTEPLFYCPVISTLLVNGCRSIATGYSTHVHPHDPKELISNVRKRLKNEPRAPLKPYFRGFAGSVEGSSESGFLCRGVYEVRGPKPLAVNITEIPIGTSVSSYKQFLDSRVEKKFIVGYEERCTDSVVDFTVTVKSDESPDNLENLLKLTSLLRTTNMHAFDSSGKIKKYGNVVDMEEEHFVERYQTYVDRRKHLISVLEFEVEVLSAKVRFFEAKTNGQILLEGVSYDEAVKALELSGFKKLPTHLGGEDKSFDYITSVKMFDVTKERVKLLKDTASRRAQDLKTLKRSTVESLWEEDLKKLEEKLGEK
ncbi:unnamed protein product, partial [Sphacelaria rigidula]